MSWADKVKATAFAALAERTATGARLFAATTPDWHVDEVWLTRAGPLRNLSSRSATGRLAVSSHTDTSVRSDRRD